MTATSPEIISYPPVSHDDLTVDTFYRDYQQRGPVKVQLLYGEPGWLATRYEDVKLVYSDRRFGKAFGLGRDTPRMIPTRIAEDGASIANMDPPAHTRLRRLTLTAFSPGRIRALHPWVDGLIDDLVDSMAAQGGPVDFIAEYAWTLPLRVITGILGIAEADVEMYRGWVDDLIGLDTGVERKGEVLESLIGFIGELIAQRRAATTDDLLSTMVNARDEGDQLSEEELISLVLTLFLAGFETTAAQIGSTLYALMAHPDLWRELRDDRSLMPAATEELWRWIPSFRFGMPMVRWAKEDVELSGGVVVPAGEPVVPEHQVANRDESVFPHGWELDFHRDNPSPHLSLAFGAHRCLGAHLAQLEVEATLTKLLDRFPSLELATAPEEVPWSPSTFLRSPASLLLSW